MILANTADRQTLVFQYEGGSVTQPMDSGNGAIGRPFGHRVEGGRLATLETLYHYFINNVPDPDEALARDPEILDKIELNSDVTQCMRKRAMTVAQLPWDVKAAQDVQDEKLAERVAKYCKWVLSQLPNIEQLFEQMEQAIIPGGVGIELVWNREADGTERPVRYFSVHKTRFLFDRLGNLCLRTRDFPVWGVHTGANPLLTTNSTIQPARGKFLYHVYRRAPGTWQKPELEGYQYYGRGEDNALYIPVTFDAFCHRFTMKWLEKYGMPPTILYHPSNMAVSRGRILEIASSLRGESIITIPRPPGQGTEYNEYKVEQLEVPSPSYDAFTQYYKERTTRAIGGILLGSVDEMSKSETGSYSDHVSRRDSGPMIFYAYDAKIIAATINDQLMPAILEHGPFHGIPENYRPRFEMVPKEEKDQLQEVQILNEAAKAVHVPEDEYYDRAGIRKPAAGERTVFMGPQAGPGGDPFDFGDGAGGPEGQGDQAPGQADQQPQSGDQGGGKQQPGGAPRTPIGSSANSRKTDEQ